MFKLNKFSEVVGNELIIMHEAWLKELNKRNVVLPGEDSSK